MNAPNPKTASSMAVIDVVKARISAYLYDLYANDTGLLANLDRWTQRRITAESLAKLALVFESDDPAEACYRDLIREVDTEAEYGIYLASNEATIDHLRSVIDEPGVSGELVNSMNTIAPVMFPEETARSRSDFDFVWLTIQARHDRAHVDVEVSRIIMEHLANDAAMPADMCHALRSLHYAHHENVVRRCCDLNLLSNDRDERDLMIMVAELVARSGCYEDRLAEIDCRAS